MNRSRVIQILERLTGKPLDLRVVEGQDLEAWRRAQEIERLAEERQRAGLDARRALQTAASSWEHLNEALIREFGAVKASRRSVDLARMLLEAFDRVYATDTAVRSGAPEEEALHDRQLSRVCDRLAGYCDVPPTVVALEYLRYRDARRREEQEAG